MRLYQETALTDTNEYSVLQRVVNRAAAASVETSPATPEDRKLSLLHSTAAASATATSANPVSYPSKIKQEFSARTPAGRPASATATHQSTQRLTYTAPATQQATSTAVYTKMELPAQEASGSFSWKNVKTEKASTWEGSRLAAASAPDSARMFAERQFGTGGHSTAMGLVRAPRSSTQTSRNPSQRVDVYAPRPWLGVQLEAAPRAADPESDVRGRVTGSITPRNRSRTESGGMQNPGQTMRRRNPPGHARSNSMM